MPVRKNAESLTLKERLELVDGFRALKANGTYDKYVLAHARAKMDHIHRAPAFLPWHRYFLVELERDLQKVTGNPELAVPYWEWPNGGPSASIWADNFMGGDGEAPFNGGHWTIVDSNGKPAGPLIREFGQNIDTLPTRTDIEQTLNTVPYDFSPWDMSTAPSFRNRLEGWYGSPRTGMHNRGHVWVGGSMLPMTSPNDPIFFLHHCFVDKIWADWQILHPDQDYAPIGTGPLNPGQRAGQNLNDTMERTVYDWARISDVLDTKALGYRYDDVLMPGSGIALSTTHHGRLSQDEDGVIHARGEPGEPATLFRLLDPEDPSPGRVLHHGMTVAIETAPDHFLRVGTSGDLDTDAGTPDAQAQFTIVNPLEPTHAGPIRHGDKISLRSTHHHYLAAEPDGRVKADRIAIGPWEEWLVTL